MLQTQHVFSHQYPPNEPSWLQHQSHHPQHQPHQAAQAHANAHANAQAQAQAQAQAAQQQHYNRMAVSNTSGPSMNANHDQGAPSMEHMTEEFRKVLGWIADLMSSSTREGALLELSKKREQVPQLALILWHSFGKISSVLPFLGHGEANVGFS
jgi:CCR4-NOT transcription complex subunit 9